MQSRMGPGLAALRPLASGARGSPSSRPNVVSSCWRLFDFLLNRSSEREQTLVDRRRHLANEFDNALPVLEDAGLPNKLIAEVVDLGLIALGLPLQRLQGKRIGAYLVRRLTLLARHALQPAQNLGALGVERVEQARKQQFSASGLVGCTAQIFRNRLVRLLERSAPRRQLHDQRADLGVVLPLAGDVVERWACPHGQSG